MPKQKQHLTATEKAERTAQWRKVQRLQAQWDELARRDAARQEAINAERIARGEVPLDYAAAGAADGQPSPPPAKPPPPPLQCWIARGVGASSSAASCSQPAVTPQQRDSQQQPASSSATGPPGDWVEETWILQPRGEGGYNFVRVCEGGGEAWGDVDAAMIALMVDDPWRQRFDPRDPGRWVRGVGDATLADGSYLYYWANTASMRWFWETVWDGELWSLHGDFIDLHLGNKVWF